MYGPSDSSRDGDEGVCLPSTILYSIDWAEKLYDFELGRISAMCKIGAK